MMLNSSTLSRHTAIKGRDRTSQQLHSRPSVVAHANASEDSCHGALASLSAGALLVQSVVGGPAAAAAAELPGLPPTTPVMSGKLLIADGASRKILPTPAAPGLVGGITRTSSGPAANAEDPDSYFDSLDDMYGGRSVPAAPVKYVECAAPVQVVAELADLNADVRDAASDYRDPAIATPQDKVADTLSGSNTPNLPDLSSAGDNLSSAADKAKAKAKSVIPGGLSVVSSKPLAEVADLNADVRDAASDYRDPAIATPQDKVADTLSGSNTPNLPDLSSAGDNLSSAADKAKAKAKSVIPGGLSAVSSKPLAEVADLNADVRDAASDYRDPAIATPQDKVADTLSGSNTPNLPDLSSAGDNLSSAADKAKAKAKSVIPGGLSVVSSKPLAEVADLNADVRDAASDYRDPAIATPQDKVADTLSGSSTPNLPDLSSAGDNLSSAADKAKAKAKAKSVIPGGLSAVSSKPLAEVADLNADVRDAASDYRDPAIATPQDKVADTLSGSNTPNLPDLSSAGDNLSSAADKAKAKAKSVIPGGLSVVSSKPLAEVADLNADVRDAASDYRDPAIATPQDKVADTLSGSSTPDLPDLSSAGDNLSSAADKAKAKAKSVIPGGLSAVSSKPLAEVADLNADVRDAASDYRDPAIATPQDKVADTLSGSNTPNLPDLSSAGDNLSSAADKAKAKAKSVIPGGLSVVSSKPLAEVADLNADVRDAASDYRDPAIATPQDKVADTLSGSSTPDLPDLSSAGDNLSSAADKAKAKAKSVIPGGLSAVSSKPLAELADLNADVRDAASDYRDPAGAVQQDNAADAARSALGSGDSAASRAASKASSKIKDVTRTSIDKPTKKPLLNLKPKSSGSQRDIGQKAGYGPRGTYVNDSAGIRRRAEDVMGSEAPGIGNARLSKPLVRDSLGQRRPQSVNDTGAAGGTDREGKNLLKQAARKITE